MMKTSLLLVVLCAVLSTCYGDDVMNEHDDSPDYMGQVNEDETDLEFDQEALFGKTHLDELAPEEAKAEIKKLLVHIDTNEDGLMDKPELLKWMKIMDDKSFLEDVKLVFDKEDTDRDGFVTFEEYMRNADMPEEYIKTVENMQPTHKNIKIKFEAADSDLDGRLTPDEFAALVHPERHDHMIEHLVRDQLIAYDKDKDGRISFNEYWAHFNPTGKVDADLPDWALHEKDQFGQTLDKNKDGYLDSKEIEEWLSSDEQEFYNEEVDHLLQNADKNMDGQLSEEEVMEEFHLFIDSPLTDYGHIIGRTHEEL